MIATVTKALLSLAEAASLGVELQASYHCQVQAEAACGLKQIEEIIKKKKGWDVTRENSLCVKAVYENNLGDIHISVCFEAKFDQEKGWEIHTKATL